MYLKSLELTGFKSFAEAKIEFPQGVTAVVGPNGTGKSNVVDSILWVLGEQSAKTLRSERMEDVIFNGTESRKPLGMVEVSLVMSGIEEERIKGLPSIPSQLGECDEVMITRRLYRNGDSEYLINKTPCRLKDIRSLFLDSRAGTKGHTIIEQGRIEQILNATPQDRRELIEETAGIVRYKKQKAEALRKLDSTQQNLLRVRDIIAEVKRQLNSLERQARQAHNYQRLQEEARTLEIRLLVQECRALIAARAEVEAELGAVEAQEAGQLTEQGQLEEQLEGAKLRLVAGMEGLSRIREALSQVEHQQSQALTAMEVAKGRLTLYEQQRTSADEELARLSAEGERTRIAIESLRERLARDEADVQAGTAVCGQLSEEAKGIAARRAAGAAEEEQARQMLIGLTVQVTRAENRLSALGAQDELVQRRLERLRQELGEVEAQHAATIDRFEQTLSGRQEGERTVQELREQQAAAGREIRLIDGQVHETEQTIGRQQEELAAVESRLKALQGVLREEMGYGREGEEERSSLRAACGGVKESVAEWLIVPPGLERAVEAMLGDRLRAWLVTDPGQARRAIEFLNANNIGRGTFVPVQPRYAEKSLQDESWWPSLADRPGVVGRAVDLLRADTESQHVLKALFQGMVIVNSLEVAVEEWSRGLWSAPDGPTLVTIDGEVLDPAGVVSGGTAGSSGGLLLRRREVQRLEEARAELTTSLQEQRGKLSLLLEQAKATREALEGLERAAREAEIRVLSLAKDETSLQRTVEDLKGRLETIRGELRAQEEDRHRLHREIEETNAELLRVKEEHAGREAGLVEIQSRLRACEEESQALQQRLTEARTALASAEAKLGHGRADLARLSEEQEAQVRRAAALTEHLAALTVSLEESRVERDKHEALFHELDQRAALIRHEHVEAQERYDRDVQISQEIEKQLASVRHALGACRERRTAIEVRRAEVSTELSLRENTLTGTYQLSVTAALAQEPEPADGVETATVREQLQKIRERLDRLGPINLAAIEEHRELEERHRFLTTQEEDLSKSVASLKEIINRINRTTKEMFLETFNELQQKFVEVFARFFPGGRAELVLTEPQPDPEGGPASEEPGVDIVAQPPGKRLKSIAMLSGGEKTLTAMALIFASFLIRPTPFCILDEIDAPLDEENIGRFTGVLRELSSSAQFIVITHNKRTMSIADSLFGVTMEEPGVSKLVSVRLAELQPA
ncbi:chromosome segregation protein SMC [Candidatus Nitrospira bockiana]